MSFHQNFVSDIWNVSLSEFLWTFFILFNLNLDCETFLLILLLSLFSIVRFLSGFWWSFSLIDVYQYLMTFLLLVDGFINIMFLLLICLHFIFWLLSGFISVRLFLRCFVVSFFSLLILFTLYCLSLTWWTGVLLILWNTLSYFFLFF